MKKASLLFLFCSCMSLLFAQGGSLKVSGTVLDFNQEGLPALPVTLSDSTGILIKAQLTDAEGSFRFDGLQNGSYQLKAKGVGYKPLETTIRLTSTSVKDLKLQLQAEMIEEVQITARKPLIQVDADKTIFNVEDNLSTTGDNAIELLRKAPGVVVDQNDGLIVEGKSGVLVYIDGRPSVLRGEDLSNYLKTLQADEIEAVEIITQPSSKYDAEGNAGIINIRLRREKGLGIKGTASAGLIYGQRLRGNSSLNLNFRAKKLNVYGAYSNFHGSSISFIDLYRIQNGNVFDAETDSEYKRTSHNIRSGADYFINKRHTVGIMVNSNLSKNESSSDSRTPIYPLGQVSPDSILFAPNRGLSKSRDFNANLNYSFKDTNGTSLNVDLDYGNYSRDRDNFQPNYYLASDGINILSQNITSQNTPTDISIKTAKMDYERTFLGGVLGAGVKFSLVNTSNTFDFFNLVNEAPILNLDRSNQFAYDENINAAYLNYQFKRKAWKFQAGLRLENTISSGVLTASQANDNQQVDRNYTNLFPSGGLTWQASRNQSWALLYSRRIRRPNYQSLNPFEYQLDELSFSKGNPFLQPQYTQNIKLSQTWKYTLTTSLSYSYVSGFFAQVTEAVGENQNFLITRNVADQQTINFSISYPFSIKPWWNVYFNAYAYHSSYIANNPAFVSVARTTFGGYAQSTFDLPARFRFEISGWWSSPSIWGGTYLTRSIGSLNLGLQKNIGNRWTAKVAVNDLLYTVPWRGATQFGALSIDGTGGSDSRQIRMNLSYKFGSKEVKDKRKRKTGLEDEQKRISN